MNRTGGHAARVTCQAPRRFRKIQLLTVEGLSRGAERPDTPPLEDPFAKAPKGETAEQIPLAAPEKPGASGPEPN